MGSFGQMRVSKIGTWNHFINAVRIVNFGQRSHEELLKVLSFANCTSLRCIFLVKQSNSRLEVFTRPTANELPTLKLYPLMVH